MTSEAIGGTPLVVYVDQHRKVEGGTAVPVYITNLSGGSGISDGEAAWLGDAVTALPDAADLANVPDPAGATDGYVWTADGADGADWAAAASGASDVDDLTTTTGNSTEMVRVAAAGGLEYRTPTQVLSDIGAPDPTDVLAEAGRVWKADGAGEARWSYIDIAEIEGEDGVLGDMLRADGAGYFEYRTPAQVLGDVGAEPALGNPGSDNYVLSSTALGVRSWVAQTAGVTDHGALTGLTDDDHTGYARLAGRAGGQSLIGGTAASNDLTLTSTSDATKGVIRLATGGGQVAIGTTGATTGILEIVGGTGAADDQGVRLSGTYSTNTAHPHRVETAHPLAVGKAAAAYDAKFTIAGSAATTDHAVGFQSRVNYAANGTMSHLYDVFCAPTLIAGKVNNRYGLYVDDVALSGSTLDANYGLYVNTLAQGTTKWGLYVAGNASYFGGNITVGGGNKRIYGDTTTPYVELSSAAGTVVAYGAACQLYLGGPIFFSTSSTQRMGVEATGSFWVGKRRADAMAQFTDTHNATNTARLITIFGNNANVVTPAAGFGLTTQYQLQSSTTVDTVAASLSVVWYEATHASRKADLVLTAYDSGGEREGLRVRANGSAAAIGFLGATPAARVAHVADPSGGATVDAEARSAINSILATLETFGFHATS